MVQLCTGCHSPGGVAESAIPRFGLHPRKEMVGASTDIDLQVITDQFPLFIDDGEQSGNGYIVCSTCHNAHQWDPINKIYNADKKTNIEGDPTNSFLRNKGAAFSICLDCHGFDALLKYKGYHMPKEWKDKYWRRRNQGKIYNK